MSVSFDPGLHPILAFNSTFHAILFRRRCLGRYTSCSASISTRDFLAFTSKSRIRNSRADTPPAFSLLRDAQRVAKFHAGKLISTVTRACTNYIQDLLRLIRFSLDRLNFHGTNLIFPRGPARDVALFGKEISRILRDEIRA